MNEQGQLDPKVSAALDAVGITYEVIDCDPDFADTAAFCEKYGYKPEDAANTILVAGKSDPIKLAACVVLATTKLDVNKKVCQLLGAKRASFASGEQTTAATGMISGGVTVFGLPSDLPIYVDSRVLQRDKVIMGGGNRSSKVVLMPTELQKLSNAEVVEDLAKQL